MRDHLKGPFSSFVMALIVFNPSIRLRENKKKMFYESYHLSPKLLLCYRIISTEKDIVIKNLIQKYQFNKCSVFEFVERIFKNISWNSTAVFNNHHSVSSENHRSYAINEVYFSFSGKQRHSLGLN